MRQALESYLYRIWYSGQKIPFLLRILSAVFNKLRSLRFFLYSSGWKKSFKAHVPVLVIGNISIGGAGKTPLVLYLIKALKAQGLKPGIISRGYGGTGSKSKNKVTIIGPSSTSLEVGDEPFMIYRQTAVPFVVGADRVQASKELLSQFPDIDLIISDDGLQHYRLQRDLEIVVIDGERGLGNTHLLPAGPLREPISRLDEVDLILSNGSADHASLQALDINAFRLQPLTFTRLNSSEHREVNSFSGRTVHAFAGIGNPQRFFNTLSGLGISVISHELSDHGHMPSHFFDKHSDDLIIMTEKDAVKYPELQSDNVWYLSVETEFDPESHKDLLDLIHRIIRKRSV